MSKNLEYCIECNNILAVTALSFCGNRECSRYGLFTAMVRNQPVKPMDASTTKGGEPK